METLLLLSLTNLMLAISSAQPVGQPVALLQPHTAAPRGGSEATEYPIKGIAEPKLVVANEADSLKRASDSNSGGSRLKLRRGQQGEAFVINEDEILEVSQRPDTPSASISDTPIQPTKAPPTDAPLLRPSIEPPATIQAPQQTPARARPHDYGDEFPKDIDNISPSTTTDDQVPEPKPSTVQGSVIYDEQMRDSAGGAVLSIFEALDLALTKSPRASALRALLPVTQSEMARATEQRSPSWSYDNGVIAEQTRRTGVVLNPEPPWKLIFRLLAAKRLVEQAKQDLLSQLWTLRAEVRLAYTEVVVAQETLETLNSLYDLAHRLMVVSEKRFQAGDVPELDVLKAHLAESQYDVERRVGLRRVVRAKQQLNIIMGRAPETPLSIPRLPPFLTAADIAKAAGARNILLPDFTTRINTLEFYLDIAMKHRYELKTLDRQIAVNKAQLRNAYGNIVPTPQFWIGGDRTGNPPTGPMLSAYYIGIDVPSNITEFQQGDIARFKAVARQLKYQTSALKNVITSEVSSAYNNLLAARQKLRIYQEHVLADSYEVARLARRSYEVGQSDITSTIQAQQNNVQIRTQYLEAIQLYQEAFTALERACGMPLLESDEI